jgi:hypothetical protein
VTDADRIRDVVGRTDRRLALLGAQDAACAVGAVTLALFAIAVLGIRLAWWAGSPAWIALVLGAAYVLAVVGWAARRAPDPERAAARIDAEYALEDRLRSALAVLRDAAAADPSRSTGMAVALVADAAASVRSVDPARAVAYHRPRWLGTLAVALVASAAIVGFPERWLAAEAPTDASVFGDLETAGKDLEARSLEVARTADPREEGLRQLATEQANLGTRLQRDEVTARDALARLSSLEERIDRTALEAGAGADAALGETRRRMEKALGAAARGGESGDRADANGKDSPDEEGKGAGDEASAERSLADRARAAAAAALEGTLSDEDAKALREAAGQLGASLEGVEGAEQLQEALEALAEGEISAEELEALAEAIDGLEARAAAQEAARRLSAANRAAKQRIAGRGAPGDEAEAGPFAGRGSTNDREGQAYRPEDEGSTMKDDAGARPDSKGDYEAKHQSERLDEQGYTSQARGKLQGSGRGSSLFVQTAPGKAAATVPYQEAYPRYLRSAERSIERSDVPPEMRDVVRDYFDSINPQ